MSSLTSAAEAWSRVDTLPRMFRSALLAASVLAFVLLFSAPAWAADVEVTAEGLQPATVQVDVGETIVWTNSSTGPIVLESDDPVWTSGTLRPGESFSLTFERAGTYDYGSRDGDVSGKVVVMSAGGSSSSDDQGPAVIAGDATLPATGGVERMMLLAAVMLGAGSLALRASSRPRA